VFDRYVYTILEVRLSDLWEPTNYTSADFVPIFEAVFTVPIQDQGFNISTQSDFLIQTYNYFLNRINLTQSQGADEGLAKLRSLFAVPVLEFNNVQYSTVGPIPNDLGKSISLAIESYRVHIDFSSTNLKVIIPWYSAWVFAALACFMSFWCLGVLLGCLLLQSPKSSQFPEVDLCSRVLPPLEEPTMGVYQLLGPLSNASSSEIVKATRGNHILVRVSDATTGRREVIDVVAEEGKREVRNESSEGLEGGI